MQRLFFAASVLLPATVLVTSRAVDLLQLTQGLGGQLAPSEHHSLSLDLAKDVPTSIRLSGYGDADFDLYLYDENGLQVGALADAGSHGTVHVTPKWNGRFHIEVVNHGPDAGSYELDVN